MTTDLPPRPPSPPPSFHHTGASITTAIEHAIAHTTAVQDTLLSTLQPSDATFASLLPLLHDESTRLHTQQHLEFYARVSPDDDVRKASRGAAQAFQRAETATSQRAELYALLVAASRAAVTDAEDARLLDKMIASGEESGFALEAGQRERLAELEKGIAEVEDQYMECVQAARDGGLWFAREELAGLAEGDLAGLPEEEGKVKVPLSQMKYTTLLGDAESEATRKRTWLAFARATEANVPRLERMRALRQDKAKLLGYQSWAQYHMRHSMERSPEHVVGFLEELLVKLTPYRDELLATLRQMKKDDLAAKGLPDNGKFFEWDVKYYSKLNRKRLNADIDLSTVADYFPTQQTVTRMLETFESAFSLQFVEVDASEREYWDSQGYTHLLWHPDVRLFAVWDRLNSTPEFLGYLYTDLYTRPGKYPGFADLPVRPAFDLPSGQGRRHTSTALVCSFNPATPDKPSLLTHNQVVLLFHELGHGIHDLVARTRWARFHGASTGDFNEAPSQMLEEWVWSATVLQKLSGHWETGETIPVALVEALQKGRMRSERGKQLTLTEMSLLDLQLSMTERDGTELAREVAKRVWPLDEPEELVASHAGETNHVMVSGMYIYLTCLVYAMDMYRSGFAEPINAGQGRRYRDFIIGRGGSVDSRVMLEEYLGRQPDPTPFYQSMGL